MQYSILAAGENERIKLITKSLHMLTCSYNKNQNEARRSSVISGVFRKRYSLTNEFENESLTLLVS